MQVLLIGRTAEQRRIDELLDGARNGSSETLVLVGEPGIGKTALLEYAEAEASDFTVARARGVESEAELPFAALHELCRPFFLRLDLLPPPQRAALHAAFGIVEQETTRFLVGAGTLSLLAAAAEERPLLLLVDDAHWVDAGSTDALAFALRRLRNDQVAALLAIRPREGRAFERGVLPELGLAGLDDASSAALIEKAFGRPPAAELEQEILALARGNPLALLELPRSAEAHALTAEPLPLGEQLERAFSARAEDLPEATRTALVVAAVTTTADLQVLSRALGELGLDVAALEPAERIELVSLVGATVQFRHPLVRSALYHAADAAERRRAHAAVAAALGTDERAAWHLAAAAVGPDDTAAETLERAAEIARRRAGFAAAAAAYERAARLSQRRSERSRRLAAGADAAWLAGRTGHALALVEEALAHTEEPARRGALLHTRGMIEHLGGDARAQWTLEQAATLLVEGDPRKACVSLVMAVGSALGAGEIERALWLSERVHAVADPERPDHQLFTGLSRGASLLMAGRPEEGLPFLQRAAAVVEDRDLFDDALEWYAQALAAFWLGDAVQMGANAAAAVEWAREHAAIATLAFASRLLARARLITGEWRAARASLSESLDSARISDQRIQEAETLGTIAWVDAAQGRAEECRRHVAEGLEIAERCGRRWNNELLHALVVLELGLGVEDGAPGVAEFRRSLADRPLRDTPANSTMPDVVEALVRLLGERDAAEALLAPFADEAERIGQPFPRAVALRCRGLLADDASYEEHFERSLELHALDRNVFAAARTRLVYGERLRRAGRRSQARRHLRAALETFERLEAEPWAERARVELRATGERLRRRDPAAREELTPQELQIALVVVEGKTNREVGAQLFLSPKTVEWHLGHVYRKLGVRSRTELARAIAR